MDMAETPSRGRDQWIDAGFNRFNTDGLGGVRVELVARDIGTSKGSFYWHFADRHELITAVVGRWETLELERIDCGCRETRGAAEDRLRSLLGTVASRLSSRSGERTLYPAAVAEIGEDITRVTRRRIDVISVSLLREHGFDEGESRRRATVALAALLGLQQLGTAGDAALIDTVYRTTIS